MQYHCLKRCHAAAGVEFIYLFISVIVIVVKVKRDRDHAHLVSSGLTILFVTLFVFQVIRSATITAWRSPHGTERTTGAVSTVHKNTREPGGTTRVTTQT